MFVFGDKFSNYDMRNNLSGLMKPFMFCVGESNTVSDSIKRANEKFLEYQKTGDKEVLSEANKLNEIAVLMAETFYLGVVDRGNFLRGKRYGSEYTKRAIEFSNDFFADCGMTREEIVYVSQLFYPIHRSYLKKHDPVFAGELEVKFFGEECVQDEFRLAGMLENLSTIRRAYYDEHKAEIDSKTEDDGDTFFR